jgi:uncharacterized membrane protein YuzA (DUF378 family)
MSKLQKHTTPENLEKYAFYWSEVRLILAAIALLLGGIPLVSKLGLYSFGNLLGFCWIVSGIASVYLLYRWINNGKKLFGRKNKKDLTAFMVTVVSGLNLGITGLLGVNIGMNISSSRILFIVVAILYIWSAYYMCKKRKANSNRIF